MDFFWYYQNGNTYIGIGGGLIILFLILAPVVWASKKLGEDLGYCIAQTMIRNRERDRRLEDLERDIDERSERYGHRRKP